jgi:zinc protease
MRAAGTFVALVCGCAAGQLVPQPPQLGPPPDIEPPAFVSTKLDNGLGLHVNRADGPPLVAIDLCFEGGALAETPEQAGLGMLLATEMAASTQTRARWEQATALDGTGSEVAAWATWDGIHFEVEVQADRALAALELLAEIVQRPAFTAGEHERLRVRQLAFLEREQSDPEVLAVMGVRLAIFGPAHRAGLPLLGTRRSLAALTLDDLRVRQRRAIRPERAAIAIAGRVDVAEIQRAVGRLFGGWRAEGTAEPTPRPGPGPQPAPRRKTFFIARPGLPQTVIAVGGRGLPETDPRQLDLRMLSARVPPSAQRWLREVENVTYGVSPLYEANAQTGYYGARLTVDPGRTGLATKSILDRYDARPEGDREREKVRLSFRDADAFTTLLGRVQHVARLHAGGRPLDQWQRDRQRLEADRDRGVEEIAFDYLAAERLQVVLVGDPDVIRREVAPLGLGEPEELRLE